ncbi:hypothetical protein [Arthrobacter livingstonensis]|uniref:hypothetical protein n=1 Tax=Arthrobacter livingstonensis TaxID=670078 RepID=UPI001B885E6A|nr:hypothetical protein [Arthrobacter livingstonensis]
MRQIPDEFYAWPALYQTPLESGARRKRGIPHVHHDLESQTDALGDVLEIVLPPNAA